MKKTPIEVHDYLHDVMRPPIQPTPEEARAIVAIAEERKEWDSNNRFYAVEAAMSYFVGREVEVSTLADAERCRDTRLHLARQIGILANLHSDINPITNAVQVIITSAPSTTVTNPI